MRKLISTLSTHWPDCYCLKIFSLLLLKDIFTFITIKCLPPHHQNNNLYLLTRASCPRVPALLYCISLWLDSEARVTSLLNAFPPCRCSNLYFTSSKTKAQKNPWLLHKTLETFFWNDTKEQSTLMKLQQTIWMSNRLYVIPTYEIYMGRN